jgi:hypothetical protein
MRQGAAQIRGNRQERAAVSGAEMATMALQLRQGWKFDFTVTGVPTNTVSYKNFIKTNYCAALVSSVSNNREVKSAQYGYGQSQRGLWATVYGSGTPYKNYDAIHELNQ